MALHASPTVFHLPFSDYYHLIVIEEYYMNQFVFHAFILIDIQVKNAREWRKRVDFV